MKVIFGVFAHPDDEAFGPSGTLLMEKTAGSEIHLICATAGQSGMNPDNFEDLASVRLKEWRSAGQLIGADSMHHLGLVDGKLSNDDFFVVVSKIKEIVDSVTMNRDDIDIEFMSIDLNGITGHIDHICVARAACYVYCTMKSVDPRVTRMRLACLTREQVPASNCEWLYMDAGRLPTEISETVDASEHIETIKHIMHAHRTQRVDCKAHLEKRGDRIAINHFIQLG